MGVTAVFRVGLGTPRRSGMPMRPGCGLPGSGGGDGRHGQGGGRIGPPPAQGAVQHQGGEREQTGSCADAAQGAIALKGAAGHPSAETSFGVGQGREDGQREGRGDQGQVRGAGPGPGGQRGGGRTRITALAAAKAMATTMAARVSAPRDRSGWRRSTANRQIKVADPVTSASTPSPIASTLRLWARSPVSTDTVPDSRPKATEIQTRRSAAVICPARGWLGRADSCLACNPPASGTKATVPGSPPCNPDGGWRV